jgi:glycosyltransferase involved in cell wall biosynthesis
MSTPTANPRGSDVQPPGTASCAAEDRTATAGVVMYADIDGSSDLESENRALAVRLIDRKFPIQVAALSGQQLHPHSPCLRSAGKHLKALLADRLTLAESVLYQSGAPSGWNLDYYGRCRVGRAAFGTDRIPDGWAECCNALDELWLPSEFHRETFAASGVERSRIRVLPRAVDLELFQPARSAVRIRELPAKSFYFLAIADEWLASGTDILIRAFVEEFAPDDDVALVLHCPPKQHGDSFADFEAQVIAYIEITLGRRLEDIPTIALLVGSLSEEDRAALLASSHAFVQPARAEPTGRHCLEALACELPVIATDWGPLSYFLSKKNSFSLSTDGLVTARPEENELIAGHRWAEPNLAHLRHQMREVFGNPKEASRRAEQGRRDVIARFDWNVVLPEWIENFRRLLR